MKILNHRLALDDAHAVARRARRMGIARDEAVTVAPHKNDPSGIPPSGGHADRPEQVEATTGRAEHRLWRRANVMGQAGGVTDIVRGRRNRHLAPLGP